LTILVVLLGAWQLAGNDAKQIAMPTFTRTFTAFVDIAADGTLLSALLITNQALVLGFALAVAISLPLGVLMGSSSTAQRIATPYLLVLLVVPMITIVPLVQSWLGLTLSARVFVVFLSSFIYMTTNTMVGVRAVSPNLKEMANSFGASRTQMLRRVVVPGATPAMMAGVRLGLARALIGMLLVELTLVGAGVGTLVIEYQARFQPAYLFAVILAVVLEAVLIMEIARRLEGHLLKWRGSAILD
jgi:ABC-type nitrate/sulfonate/bicarbonate transport system permease component